MIVTLYQQYLYLIGKLKDIYKLQIDVPHRDIHTFYSNKTTLFKLLFGQYQGEDHHSIVISFHVDLKSHEVVRWFCNVQTIHPEIRICEHFIEDDNGETYLGEDADIIKNLKLQQVILSEWLDSKNDNDIENFKDAKIVGRKKEVSKAFNSQTESDKARIEFERMNKPATGETVH